MDEEEMIMVMGIPQGNPVVATQQITGKPTINAELRVLIEEMALGSRLDDAGLNHSWTTRADTSDPGQDRPCQLEYGYLMRSSDLRTSNERRTDLT